jgi:hypothetical protein
MNKALLLTTVVAFVIACIVTRELVASPSVGTPTTTSQTILSPNTSTTVTITSAISDPTLIPGSVNLIRVDSNSNVVGTVGVMQNVGNNNYSYTLTLNEPVQGPFAFEVSAAFKGLLKRVISAPLDFAVANPAGSELIDVISPNSPIILGTVISQQGALDPTGQIISKVTVAVGSELRGSISGSTIVLGVPGGTYNGLQSFTPGSPSFTTGETVVLILGSANSQGVFSLPDAALDVFHIQTSPTLGQIAVVDGAYSQLDGAEAPSLDFSSFLQRSIAGQVPLTELYTRLGL